MNHDQLIAALHTGKLDDIECPRCQRAAMSVRFSRPSQDVYRLWFLCCSCQYTVRVQCAARPPCFSADRVDDKLTAYDTDLLQQRRIGS
jgi:hypothetical protein